MSGDATDLADRFFAMVNADGPCWEWQGATMERGYGVFNLGQGCGTELAHRFAYQTLVGDIPDGLQLDHLCRNPPCVDPDHLEPVTQRDNMMRGYGPSAVNARKSTCPAGHPLDVTYVSPKGRRMRRCSVCQPPPGTGRQGNHQKGEEKVGAKLTWEAAEAIRERHRRGGVTQAELARQYGVSPRRIRQIINGEGWKKT